MSMLSSDLPKKQGVRVLLVDDDPYVLRDFTKLLRSFDCSVEARDDPEAARAALKTQAFDVIVSDINMPRMSGTEFLRLVRQEDLDVPVILVTGEPSLDTAVQAVRAGAFQYLMKPVDLATLTSAVQKAAHLHELARYKREALELVGAERMRVGDRAGLEARFGAALERLWIAFQPIVERPENRVVAYEALVRSSEPTLPSPADLFDAAERLNRVRDLGRAIRAEIARCATEAPEGVLLFVNIHPQDLADHELCSESAPLSGIGARVVLEITERSSLESIGDLNAPVRKLRDLGFRLAVDDLGAGYAGLTTLTQIEPDFVKLDRALVHGVDESTRRRSVIRSILRLCKRDLSLEVIAEGIETDAQREILEAEGCSLFQGYFFARPQRGFVPLG